MSLNHNRIKVADLEQNQPDRILTTNQNGELEFTNINDIKIDSYNALDYNLQGKALDARQGKVLKDLIDNINALLASDNVNLNTLQELVDAIEVVQNSLNTLLVNDLTTGGATKALTSEMGKQLQNNKVDKVTGKSLLSDTEITRLGTLSNYTHPANHPPGIIIQDSSNRFVTDAEKTTWNSKQANIVTGTNTQYFRGDKTWQTLDKTAVGLTNVDNTTDLNKPISTATQTALNSKADLLSPLLTGVPTAPTAATGTNTTQLATTAFVKSEILSDSSILHRSTNENFTGIKSSTNSGATNINGLNLTNNGTDTLSSSIVITNNNIGRGILLTNTGTGHGYYANNTAAGQGIFVNNNGNGIGIYLNNASTGNLLYLNSDTASTGDLLHFRKNNVVFARFDQNSKFIATNSGTTSTIGIDLTNSADASTQVLNVNNTGAGRGVLLTNGSTGSSLVIANNGTGTGSYVNNGSTGLGYSIDNGSTGTAIYINSQTASTGDLMQFRKNGVLTTKIDQNGLFSATNSGTTLTTGVSLTNNGSGTSQVLSVTNTSSGRGIYINNTSSTGTGAGIYIDTPNTSTGLIVNPSGNSNGIRVNTDAGGGFGLLLNSSNTSTGALLAFAKNGIVNTAFDFNGKLTTDSPNLTGIPVAPTATVGTNTTQLATTAFVLANSSANAVTGTGTPGQVSFWNGTKSQTSDTNFVWNNSTKKLLIGTTLTDAVVNIASEGAIDPLCLAMYNDDVSYGANIQGKRYAGTKALPTGVLSNMVLTGLYGAGWDGTTMSTNVAAIRCLSKENFTSTSKGTYIDFSTTSTGATARSEKMRIEANGSVLINSITDNSLGKLQVNGTITASPATIANQVVIKSQIDLKADLVSPPFTGTPTAPTAAAGTNTTQIATTAFVLANSASIPHLKSNNTDLTVWNNGKSGAMSNTSFGERALRSTTATSNTFNSGFGVDALASLTTGIINTAIGYNTLSAVVTGLENTGIGGNALRSVTGSLNTGIGSNAGGLTTSGFGNVMVGAQSLSNNTTGSQNVMIGINSGAYATGGATFPNTVCNDSIFIGAGTIPLSSGQTNQIIIGTNAVGKGSNTTVIGNAQTTDTYIAGRINGVKRYKLINMNQSGTGIPTFTVLENSIGSIVWTRSSSGTYTGTLSGAFTSGKVHCTYTNGAANAVIALNSTTNNTISLYSSTLAGILTDGYIAFGSLTIEVYP
ncbi:hypothetical protein [Flavobacterium sp. JAS]|uniref:beta strand repeat-containing protein n=1 Tax=Flavobacterium sp. JAS TaxID=2897329 RepID=UPI001E4E707C|nr:hypothetical protein [Flavobacterium sp. JAS]MCD0470498.1 hypothetical protein [Flavobacterium sp. JAS]